MSDEKPKTVTDELDPNKVKEIDREVQKVQAKMSENLGKVLHRGEQIEQLQTRAENLRESAHDWKKAAKKLSCREQFRACCFFCPCI